MRIELLKSQPVPCTRFTAFAGMLFEVQTISRMGGVWIQHMGHSVLVPEGEYKDVTPAVDFLERRAYFRGVPYELILHRNETSKAGSTKPSHD